MTADYKRAVELLENYLTKSNEIELFVEKKKDGKVIWGNEFVEYYVEERNDSGFIGCDSVEMITQTVFQFYCPDDETEFLKVMSILS